jgi:hypothetical protein
MLQFSLLPAIFPNGQFLSPRWRKVLVSMYGIFAIALITVSFLPGPLQYNGVDTVYPIDNPFGLTFLPGELGPTLNALLLYLILLPAVGGIASLVARWRSSKGEGRQQLKWFAFHLSTAVTIQLIMEFIGEYSPQIFDSIYYIIVVVFSFVGFPTVIGIAVLRYRLYDIDVIIRRTLQYTLVTGLLALMYFGGVVILQGILSPLTGASNSPFVTVVTTLGIIALFNPLRSRVQAFIDRRFYRQKYDAEQALAQFAAVARDEVDMDKLTAVLLQVVKETMQPEQVTLWLKPMNRER